MVKSISKKVVSKKIVIPKKIKVGDPVSYKLKFKKGYRIIEGIVEKITGDNYLLRLRSGAKITKKIQELKK